MFGTFPCKTCQVKNLTFLEILTFQGEENNEPPGWDERMHKRWKVMFGPFASRLIFERFSWKGN